MIVNGMLNTTLPVLYYTSVGCSKPRAEPFCRQLQQLLTHGKVFQWDQADFLFLIVPCRSKAGQAYWKWIVMQKRAAWSGPQFLLSLDYDLSLSTLTGWMKDEGVKHIIFFSNMPNENWFDVYKEEMAKRDPFADVEAAMGIPAGHMHGGTPGVFHLKPAQVTNHTRTEAFGLSKSLQAEAAFLQRNWGAYEDVPIAQAILHRE